MQNQSIMTFRSGEEYWCGGGYFSMRAEAVPRNQHPRKVTVWSQDAQHARKLYQFAQGEFKNHYSVDWIEEGKQFTVVIITEVTQQINLQKVMDVLITYKYSSV